MPDPRHVALTGSERAPLPGARKVGPAPPAQRFDVTILLTPKSSPPSVEALGDAYPDERKHLSRAALANAHGADASSITKIRSFAKKYGLEVIEESRPRRTVVLRGTTRQFGTAFNVELAQYEHAEGTYRGRTGPVHVPEDIASVVEGVFGLDDRPQAKPHFKIRSQSHGFAAHHAVRAFTPIEVAEAYQFPTTVDGTGQCIGIIELGGGYKVSELKKYFKGLGITPPVVKAVSIGKKKNHPTGNPDGPDGEVMLDIEVAGAVAPGSTIVVYFAENTDPGFLNAITTAVHDNVNKPSVISISWGASESQWTAQSMRAFDSAFQDAALAGVTVCAAAGDGGSSDGETDALAHVDFPASSPHVLGCGGTRLEVSGTAVTESVWNDAVDSATGGGVSDVFDLPAWQTHAHVPPSSNPGGRVGRGVPDVAGDADPNSGYTILVDGTTATIGGTSAVAPLWAGLIALINQHLGTSCGYLNPLLYSKLHPKQTLRDVTQGDNGAYSATTGWDPCTGLGSPKGDKLSDALARKA